MAASADQEPPKDSTPRVSPATHLGPPPRAVVLDTNTTGKGTFNANTVRNLAERLGHSGIELWIPQQVVLEWARHAADEVKKILGAWRSLTNSGLIEIPAPSDDPSAVTKQFTDLIEGIQNVTIVPMTGDAAIAGITDQILGTGPGRTKSDVKTGAADSSFVRDAIANADNNPARIVFCSANESDIRGTTRSMGFDDSRVRVIRSIHALYSALFAATATGGPESSIHVAARLADHLLGLASTDPSGGDPHSYDTTPWIDIPDLDVNVDRVYIPDDFEVLDYNLDGPLEVIAVTDLEILDVTEGTVGDGDKTYTAILGFRLLLQGVVEATGYELDNNGEATYSWVPVETALVSVPCTADLSDLHVSNVEASDTADATTHEMRGADPSDLWIQVVEPLTRLSGLGIDDGDLADEKNLSITGLEGRSVLIEPCGGPTDEEWVLTFTLQQQTPALGTSVGPAGTGSADDSVIDVRTFSIRCEYDPGSRVWAGADSFDSGPPYIVVSSDIADVHAAIGAVWRWLLIGD